MLASIGLYLMAVAADLQAPRTPVLIARDRFACLVTHIDRLIAARDRMARRPQAVTVDLLHCPPVLRQNFTSWPTNSRERGARYVELTASQLRCIRANRQWADRLVRNGGGGLYELQMAPCPPR